MTKLMKCSCTHKAQDELHGKNMRVFNRTQKGTAGVPEYRCTVCKAHRTK